MYGKNSRAKTRKILYREGISRVHQISLSCNPIPPPKYGGIETVVSNLVHGLIERGIPTFCYSPAPLDIEGCYHVETLPKSENGPKEGVYIANTKEHLKAITQGLQRYVRPGDVIHLHHPEQSIYIKRKKRLTSLLMGWNFVETAHWLRVSLDKNIVYPSKSLRNEINKPGKVIPHGINTSLFKPSDSGTFVNDEYLLYAGRLREDKGLHLAAEVANKLGIELRVAGPLQDHEYAESIIGKINYLGELKPQELVKQYQNAVAFIHLNQYIEPFGLAVVEAMACGTPVITTGIGGTGETVIPGETGFFCKTKESLVKAIKNIDKLSREDCVARARIFSIKNMTESYLKYYSETYG